MVIPLTLAEREAVSDSGADAGRQRAADGTVEPQRERVLAAAKARRSAPPALRAAVGLDGGSAHALKDRLLTTVPKSRST